MTMTVQITEDRLSDDRLLDLRDEFADWLDGLTPELPDGPGAVSACYTSLSLGEVSALVTEVLAAREADAWQPIETAPKDGTLIWLYADGVRSYAEHSIARWGRSVLGEGWFNAYDGLRVAAAPTHWRSLPSPPPALKETTNAA